MREIKFRGKRVSNGEWVYGWYIKAKGHWHNKGIHEDWIICHAMQNGGWFALGTKYPVIPETVGQFTGLHDKNGVEIYEDDIVRATSRYDSGNMVIVWDRGEFIQVLCENYATYQPGMGHYSIKNFVKEKIGTIHDNPELICTHTKKYDNVLLTSLPPKQRWVCTKCGATGIDTIAPAPDCQEGVCPL